MAVLKGLREYPPYRFMGKLRQQRKMLAKLSDEELDKYIISDEPYLLDAIRERTYQTDKKLIKFSRHLIYCTIALIVLSFALLAVEIRGIFVPKVTSQPKEHFEFNGNGQNYQTNNKEVK